MSCPSTPLPSSAFYFYTDSVGFVPPRCGQTGTITVCGANQNLTPGMTITLISGPGAATRYTYKVIGVGAVVNGQSTVQILNEGGAPDGGPLISGDLRWQSGNARDWRDSCDSLREVEYASHFAVVSPPNPNDCCNPGCGCAGRLPIQPGAVVFVPNPDLPGTFIPVSATSDVDVTFGGDVTFNQNVQVNGNLCVATAPLDTTATPVGVTAAGCLRRVRTQRFVPENRHLLTEPMALNPPTSGTLTLTPPPGATHALIDVTVYHWDAGNVNNRAIGMLMRQNDANPFTPDDVVAFVYERNKDNDDSSSDTSAGSAYIPLAATAPQIKWETRFNAPPVFTGSAYNPYRGYVFFLRGYLVEQ